MDQTGSASGLPGSRSRFGSPNTRRTFMKRAISGLAIAVPAFRVLSSATPAAAATNACTGSGCPGRLVGTFCAGQTFSTSCKGPAVAACMEEWVTATGRTYFEQAGWCTP
jgi:hypothetical protein